ncbi:cupin domain-containing protein [Mucilaginibacter sp. OK283]|jgi:quercetin dioxygenase-like cupin family protein|uniref:cupin domain-containing protein n=1 Tax=Mucilaginibacter sp. OK283 TaxID=1881049 RepID=UPI0008AFDF08|nr:cupin domain-containing protein [Mucilaginibacter sp. OK283]SEP25608.1 Cupin domain-containing protein [Mucilaginibacter sp. OK283]
MKRNKFIAAVLTFAAVPFAPFAAIVSKKSLIRVNKGFKIQAGEGRIHGHIKLKGVNSNILDVKISGKDTDGELAIFEQTSLSQGRGTPLHIHPTQDEIFYVLEGSYFFKVGEDKFHLTTGESIFLPKNVPHAWTQVSAKGKMTVTLQPAGKLEEFFVAMQSLDHEPSDTELAKIFSDHEMQLLGPPLKVE